IGWAFFTAALHHKDQFPFNVSTNLGGTAELCERDRSGFEKDATLHFRAISNELRSPKILVCPADPVATPAKNLLNLSRINVSYQIHTGSEINENKSNELLVVCPIHGHGLFCDGVVLQGNSEPMNRRLSRAKPGGPSVLAVGR